MKSTNEKGLGTMNLWVEVVVAGSLLTCAAGAQEAQQPALRKGVSVQMPVAAHAVEMRAADEPNSTVVAIRVNGEVYAGVQRTEPSELSQLGVETVYVKADARAPLVIGLFFGFSLQLAFMGLLGEYVGAIHTQLQNRPYAIERERMNFEFEPDMPLRADQPRSAAVAS